jgi:hypothetical protein
MLDKLSVANLRKLIRKYNAHIALKNYSKMNKADLIKAIHRHMDVDENGNLTIRVDPFDASTKDYEVLKKSPPKKSPPKKSPPKKSPPKKPSPKKPSPKKPSPKKKEEQKDKLHAVVQKVKEGDDRFVKNFKDLDNAEKVDAMMKQIVLTGRAPKPEKYLELASSFYSEIFTILKQSPMRAIPEIINKFQLTVGDLKNLYQANTQKIDFFPTPKICIDVMFKALPKVYQSNVKILEGTAGIGNVAFYMNELFKNSKIVANELNKKLIKIMDLFLPDNIDITNKNFFDIKQVDDFNIIFLNPPFGSTAEKTQFLWAKFLFHAIKLLNTKKKGGGILLFICPRLINRNEVDDKNNFTFHDMFNKKDRKGTLPSTVIKYINQLENKNYSSTDFTKCLNAIDDDTVDKLNNKQKELLEIIENDYGFDHAETLGTYSGFGGTDVRCQLALIQVF